MEQIMDIQKKAVYLLHLADLPVLFLSTASYCNERIKLDKKPNSHAASLNWFLVQPEAHLHYIVESTVAHISSELSIKITNQVW